MRQLNWLNIFPVLSSATGRDYDSTRLIGVAYKPRAGLLYAMEQRIIHACGHEQAHYLTGFEGQQERKAKWLKSTTCRDCFVAEKRAEEVAAAALSSAAISHLVLPPLIGTDRQINWASTIRTKRLAALTNSNSDTDCYACLQVTDAKWWIDYRDLTDVDLMAAATKASDIRHVTAVTASITDMPGAA